MSGNPGSRRDHNRFCEIEGWALVRNARGKAVGHHVTFELELPDGQILRTRISRPVNNDTYGPSLWSAILGPDQLRVSETEFWACVHNRELPDRGTGAPDRWAKALPADLVYQLINVVGVPEDQVAKMNMDEATAVMTEHWSKPRHPGDQ
ncbi:MAG: cytotoxic translational repressor of toxin-antitoxin stability system [Jiangellaceae bacterium]